MYSVSREDPGKEGPLGRAMHGNRKKGHVLSLTLVVCCAFAVVGKPSLHECRTSTIPLLRMYGGGRLRAEAQQEDEENEKIAERLLQRLGGSINIDDMAEVKKSCLSLLGSGTSTKKNAYFNTESCRFTECIFQSAHRRK